MKNQPMQPTYDHEESGAARVHQETSLQSGIKSGTLKQSRTQTEIWYDSIQLERNPAGGQFLDRVANTLYTGVVLYANNWRDLVRHVPRRMRRVIQVDDAEIIPQLLDAGLPDQRNGANDHWIMASGSTGLLNIGREKGFATCLRSQVADATALTQAIERGSGYNYLIISFSDPTNIPLELVIASLQTSNTTLIKEISDPHDINASIVSLGVMEIGADGVMFSPVDHETMDQFLAKLRSLQTKKINIQPASVIHSEYVGMGHRSCIDLATLFSLQEGMLIGSTSQGGLLCCPEVFYLPYMERRPFRVNAGAVHSYVYGVDDRTNYLSELRAGLPAMIVSTTGSVRQAPIGRVKTEVRPLRLIEVEFLSGERINVLMQDDWHVRIFSQDGLPLNITDLKQGDMVLGHVATPGRHVGIKIDETIIET